MWVKLDDNFADHPKVVGLSDRAFRTYIRVLCYVSRHLTDGLVPPGMETTFGRRDLDELHAAGLLDATAGAYSVHGYLDYNPSREKVTAEREAARRRKDRRTDSSSSDEPSPNVGGSSGEVRANVGKGSASPSLTRPSGPSSTASNGPNGMHPLSAAEAAGEGLEARRGGPA